MGDVIIYTDAVPRVGFWGVFVEVLKRGKLHPMWCARYVDEAGARFSYDRRVRDQQCAYLVIMPDAPSHNHVCAPDCLCIASIVERTSFPPRDSDLWCSLLPDFIKIGGER